MSITHNKIHAHIKHFIQSVILTEIESFSKIKNSLWKELAMNFIHDKILININEVSNHQQFIQLVDDSISQFQVELQKNLEILSKTIKNIPFDVIKSIK